MSSNSGKIQSFVQVASKKIEAKVKKKLHEAMKAASARMFTLFASLIKAPKTGHWYYKPDGTMYRASVTGDYPAFRTGKLLEQLRIFPTGPDAKVMRIYIISRSRILQSIG